MASLLSIFHEVGFHHGCSSQHIFDRHRVNDFQKLPNFIQKDFDNRFVKSIRSVDGEIFLGCLLMTRQWTFPQRKEIAPVIAEPNKFLKLPFAFLQKAN
jgi:hypothetical protein